MTENKDVDTPEGEKTQPTGNQVANQSGGGGNGRNQQKRNRFRGLCPEMRGHVFQTFDKN